MELLNHLASSLLLQIAVMTGCLFAVIGMWQVFATPTYIRWPWLKGETFDTDEAATYFRKGRAAGLYYYCSAIKSHGLNRITAYMQEVEKAIGVARSVIPEAYLDDFNAGVLEGHALGNSVILQVRQNTLTNYVPDLQVRLANIRRHVGAAYGQSTGEAATYLQVAMDGLDRLRGEPK